eukprot:Em0177g1a
MVGRGVLGRMFGLPHSGSIPIGQNGTFACASNDTFLNWFVTLPGQSPLSIPSSVSSIVNLLKRNGVFYDAADVPSLRVNGSWENNGTKIECVAIRGTITSSDNLVITVYGLDRLVGGTCADWPAADPHYTYRHPERRTACHRYLFTVVAKNVIGKSDASNGLITQIPQEVSAQYMIPRLNNNTAIGTVLLGLSVNCYNISVVDWEEDGSVGSQALSITTLLRRLVASPTPPPQDPPPKTPPPQDPRHKTPRRHKTPPQDPAATDPAATDPPPQDPAATDPPPQDPAAQDPAATRPAATRPRATRPRRHKTPPPQDPAATRPAATRPAATRPRRHKTRAKTAHKTPRHKTRLQRPRHKTRLHRPPPQYPSATDPSATRPPSTVPSATRPLHKTLLHKTPATRPRLHNTLLHNPSYT